jgi:hypothetical protein
MPIFVACPECKQQHQAADSLAGTACRCPCGGVVVIPLIVTCGQCGAQHEAPDHLSGLACRCSCGGIVQIPMLQAINPLRMRSIFDELTEADLTRQAAVQKPVAILSDSDVFDRPRIHPSYIKAIEEEGTEDFQRGRVPVQINLAGFSLAVGGGAELIAATLAFMVIARDGLSTWGVIGMIWGAIGAMNVVVAILVLNGSPYGQLFGLMTAALNIASLSPRLIAGSVFTIFSLASSEATAWFRAAAKRNR